MRSSLLLFLLVSLLYSCSKHHGETYSFQGEVGKKIGVTGNLEINNNSITGSYHYHLIRRQVTIQGNVEGDSIHFKGFNPEGKLIDYFDGVINTDNSISGVWRSADGQRSMPFYYSYTMRKSYTHYVYSLLALLVPLAIVVYVQKKKSKPKVGTYSRGAYNQSLHLTNSFEVPESAINEKRSTRQSNTKKKTSVRSKRVKPLKPPRTINDKYSFDDLLNNKEEAALKGKAFERFVKDRFERKYYKWLESRSDDRYGEESPESNKYPDFVFSLKYCEEGLNDSFAVECKYRSNLQKVGGMYRLFDARQLSNYLEYSKSNNFPTFVILGVGGEPSAPESLYIIPLERLENLKGKFEESVGIRSADLSSYLKRQYRNFRFFPSSQDLG